MQPFMPCERACNREKERALAAAMRALHDCRDHLPEEAALIENLPVEQAVLR